MTSYSNIQQAVDTVCQQYDELREQGIKHLDALDFLRLEHGVKRSKLAAIINDRDAGLHGTSGDTTYGATSTPSSAYSPVHGGYPGQVGCPDTFPEDWS